MRGITNVTVSGGGGGGTTTAILYYMTGDPDYEGYFVRATGLLSGTVYNTEIGADGNAHVTVTGMEYYSLEFYYVDENDQEVSVFTDALEVNMGCFYYISIGYDISSWEGIQNILNAHKETELLTVGDELTANIGGVDYIYQIGGINLYDSHEVIFVPKVCIGTYKHHTSNTNVGGWSQSDIRTYLNGTFKTMLPSDVKKNLKLMSMKTSAGGSSPGTIITTDDYLWLPRNFEISGGTQGSATAEVPYCNQYPIFATQNQRIRTLNGVANAWWQSSAYAYASSTTGFCYVNASGTCTYSTNNATSANGLVPCFRFTANS